MHFWPDREYLKSSNIPGYRRFWAKTGKNAQTNADPRPWELFLKASTGVEESVAFVKANHKNEYKHMAAVYEFAIVHPARPNKRVKVYVGKTNDFHDRTNQYLSPSHEGGRMWLCFDDVIKHGCQVWRYCYFTAAGKMPVNSEPDRAVHQMETRWLSYYDYAWNLDANPPKRDVYLEPTEFCCISTGCKLHSRPAKILSKDEQEAQAIKFRDQLQLALAHYQGGN